MKRVLFLLTIGLVFGMQAGSPGEVLSVGPSQLLSVAGTCQVDKEAKCEDDRYPTDLCKNKKAVKSSKWYCENCICGGKWVPVSLGWLGQ